MWCFGWFTSEENQGESRLWPCVAARTHSIPSGYTRCSVPVELTLVSTSPQSRLGAELSSNFPACSRSSLTHPQVHNVPDTVVPNTVSAADTLFHPPKQANDPVPLRPEHPSVCSVLKARLSTCREQGLGALTLTHTHAVWRWIKSRLREMFVNRNKANPFISSARF